MKISKIAIKNVLGITDFELDTSGKITLLSGTNGSGKTSAIEAIKASIGGGNLVRIKSVGAEEDDPAEVSLVLDPEDGDPEGQILIRKKDGKLDVRRQVGDSEAFDKVPSPQKFLNSLFDGSVSNPVELLTAKDKDLIQLLLSALPMSHRIEQMWESVGLDPKELPPIATGRHPLQEIADAHAVIFNERTGVNRDEKQKRATADQLRRTIPAEKPVVSSADDKQAELDDLKLQATTLRMSAQRAKSEAEEQNERQLEAARKSSEATIASMLNEKKNEMVSLRQQLEKEMEEKIKARSEELDNLMEERNTAVKDSMSEVEYLYQKRKEEIQLATDCANDELVSINQKISEVSAEVATLRERAEDAVRIRTLREQADSHEEQADNLVELSQRFTSALKALEIYKAELVKDLPIKGLDLSGGEVRVNGVPWAQLNTAQRIDIAVTICMLKFEGKPFKPVFVDGAEALDSENLKLLSEKLKNKGANALIGRVCDAPFSAKGL